jgi:hypothetical protein
MMVTGTVVAGTSIARQSCKDQDHDQHEQTGLDQRLVDLVDRFRDEFSWCRTARRRTTSCGNAFASASIFFFTACSTSSALAPGDWNTPMPVAGLLLREKIWL